MLKHLKQIEEFPLVLATPVYIFGVLQFSKPLMEKLIEQGNSLLAVLIVWALMIQTVAPTQILHRNLCKEKIIYLLNKYGLLEMFQRNLQCLQTISWLSIAVITLSAFAVLTGAFWPGIPFAVYALTLLTIVGIFTYGTIINYERFQKITPEDRQLLRPQSLYFKKL